jgi:hypothetical protein
MESPGFGFSLAFEGGMPGRGRLLFGNQSGDSRKLLDLRVFLFTLHYNSSCIETTNKQILVNGAGFKVSL